MTEDQIERRVERVMDALDARLMSGKLSQADYDWEVVSLDKWASQQYRAQEAAPVRAPWVETDIEDGPGGRVRLSRSIRVF
jgi:hypothetical protein